VHVNHCKILIFAHIDCGTVYPRFISCFSESLCSFDRRWCMQGSLVVDAVEIYRLIAMRCHIHSFSVRGPHACLKNRMGDVRYLKAAVIGCIRQLSPALAATFYCKREQKQAMKFSALALLTVLVAPASVSATAETNAERFARGLPPLAPRRRVTPTYRAFISSDQALRMKVCDC